MTAAEALQKTRELFAATHWGKGAWYNVGDDGKVRYCLVGGLRFVVSGDPYDDPCGADYEEAIEALYEEARGGDSVESFSEKEDLLTGFNDDADRQLDDILRLIDQAASKVTA